MLSKIVGFSLAALTASAVLDEAAQALAEAQCVNVISSSGSVYDLRGLYNKDSIYTKTVTDSTDKLKWNYCTYGGDVPESAYGVVVTADAASTTTVVATDSIDLVPDNLRDAEDAIIGIVFSQDSDTVCDGDTMYSMQTTVTCDEAKTGVPAITSVKKNVCVYEVALVSDAGCATLNVDVDAYMGWLYDNEWVIGLIYVVAGPVIALFGLQWFPYVAASLIAIFVIGIVTSLSLAFGWMTSTVGTITVLVVALLLGVLAGMLVRRNIWIMIGLLGLVAGFFSGSLVYALIFGISGWKSVWGFWVISVVMAAVGCVASCYLGKALVLLSTSMVGSYMFMRAWTLFFPGNYPSEAELIDETSELDLNAIFWVFIGVFVLSFIGSAIFQTKRNITHEDLDKYERA